LSPKQFSSRGAELNLLHLTRFVEIFGYFSPSLGYSFQVTFLGLFSILMGSNDDLKREAVAALEAGGLLSFGVSEKEHGSDLLGNEFTITETSPGSSEFIANGKKYYIGNSRYAAMISILAKKFRQGDAERPERQRRAPFALIAVRPGQTAGYRDIKKIRTIGVRSGYVGEFEVRDHPLPGSDIIAEGRTAWDAVFGAVTLGKFFLGFASVGICEHAIEEAVEHLRRRVLYRQPAMEMAHLKYAMAQGYARLAGMKLYAYRALDYVQAASEGDRRYLLFCAVQKAKVSTEGVKVMGQLSECMGAKGFEADTYFESAMRDIQLIPSLEGSTHINLGVTGQFIREYFRQCGGTPEGGRDGEAEAPEIKSVVRGDVPAVENPYLMQARSSATANVIFPHFLDAHKPLRHLPNVRRFAAQAKVFAKLVRVRKSGDGSQSSGADAQDLRINLSLGQCMATIAYGQLIAENIRIFEVPTELTATIFHLLIGDLSTAASGLAALPGVDAPTRGLARRIMAVPKTTGAEWDFVAGLMSSGMEG
jgi:acyl-CoA dehydrogenase